MFIHYRGGFFYVYGLDRILIVCLWTVDEPFSISVDSNGSLTVNTVSVCTWIRKIAYIVHFLRQFYKKMILAVNKE